MLPGPTQIIACPHCKGQAHYMTLNSGNTIDAKVWTDGYQYAPMLPLPPSVVKCTHCNECYWLSEAEEIGTVDPWEELDSIPGVQEPTEEDYYLAIDKNLAKDKEQEKSLRIFAWWKRNAQFRKAVNPSSVSVSDSCGKNLEALLVLLLEGRNDEDRIMLAEVLRELSKFDAAKKVLMKIKDKEFSKAVDQILNLCEQRNNCVQELEFEE